MKTRIPFAPGAVRDLLRQDPDFTAVIPPELITTRDKPDVMVRPFVLCRSATTKGTASQTPSVRCPLVQVDVIVPDRPALQWPATGDPEEIAWDIAGLAGEVIGRARAVQFRNCAWNGEWIDGPMNLIDDTRGPGQLLFRAPIRVELVMVMKTASAFAWA